MPEYKALAEYVKNARNKKGESQEEFAWNCGLSKDSISLIERGEANPRLESVKKIAAYTGDSVADIFKIKLEE